MTTKTPQIRAITRDNLADVARDMKGILDVREGLLGDPLDANVTYRDLVDAGALVVRPFSSRARGQQPAIVPGASSDGYVPEADLTPPDPPQNFTATGGFAIVSLNWDDPVKRNHAYTEIWRSDTNAIGNAILVGTSNGVFFTDPLGTSAQKFYWARFVSRANIKGPFNAVNGTPASTALDPGLLLESLTGQIAESHLFSELGARIDLIDGPQSLENSVAARIAAEAQARSDAILEEAQARTLAISNEASARSDGLIAEATARTTSISQASNLLQTQIDLLSAASSGDFGELLSVIRSEETQRQEVDNVLAAVTNTLIAVNGTNTAGLQSEAMTRADTQSAQASQINVLLANSGDNRAALLAESSVRTAAASASANQISGLLVQTAQNTAGLNVERLSSVTEREALSSQITALSASSGSNAAAILQTQSAQTTSNAALASISTGLSASLASAAAAVLTEQDVRLASDLVAASQLTSLSASLGLSTAGLQLEQSSRTTADSALSSQLLTLSSKADQSLAAVILEQGVRAERDLALASQALTLSSKTDQANAALILEQLTRVEGDTSLSSLITSVAAASGANAAALKLEQDARTTFDSATTSSLLTLSAATGGNTAGLAVERLIRTTELSSLSSQTTSLSAAVGASNAGLQLEQFARATADSAAAGQLLTLAVSAGSTAASINGSNSVRIRDGGALASQVSSIAAAAAGAMAAIRSETTARSDALGAVSSRVDTFQVGLEQNRAAISVEASARQEADGQLLSQYTVKTEVGGLVAGFGLASTAPSTTSFVNTVNWESVSSALLRIIVSTASAAEVALWNEVVTTRKLGDINNDGAVDLSDSIAILKYSASGGSDIPFSQLSYIEQELEVVLTGNPTKYAAYLNLNAEADAAGFSEFGIRADRFYVAPPTRYSPTAPLVKYRGLIWADTSSNPPIVKYWDPGTNSWANKPVAFPFIVSTTTQEINGVTAPPGVHIDAAYIRDGTITKAKIGLASIDDANIVNLDVSKLANIENAAIGADLFSTNYDAGKDGWKIHRTGSAEFNTVALRGQITGGQFTGYNWPTTGGGYYLGPSGLLLGRYSATDATKTYFQFDAASGNIFSNGFSIVDGSATFSGQVNVTSGGTGARMEITNSVIRVFDAAGVVRVKIGQLT